MELLYLLFIGFCFLQMHCHGLELLEMGEADILLSFKRGLSQQVDELPDWNDTSRQSFCSWTGIVCSSNSTVSRIELGSKNLTGSLSPVLGNLHNLQQLNLSDNSLSGRIPDELFSVHGSLANLNLSFNNFTGPIPVTISASISLHSVDLSRNSFVGEVPVGIGLLSQLQVLRLEGNNLTGKIPSSMGNCSQLMELSLIENAFSGEIPDELGHLRRLEYLRLYRNKLTGYVPGSLSNCSNIKELLLSENFLVGTIPETYGLLSKVKLLYLWGNKLTGVIPRTLSNCTELVQLLLDGNNLSGTLPPELGNRLTKLQILSIHSNLLSGAIPESIANLSSLHSLWSHENLFSGSIPRTIGAMKSLARISLEKNELSGWIPEEIGNNSRLQVLRLHENKLEGEIPLTLGILKELQGLSLQSNRLQGTIPPQLGSCSSLNILKLQNNMLTGQIPSNLSQLSQLRNLDVSKNKLTGVIPASLSSCFRLENLDVSYNFLSGGIPQQLLRLSALSSGFNLSNNRLTGDIPRDFAKLTLVQAIDLSANQLTGSMPDSLGACAGLLKLDLSSNQLTGRISAGLGKLLGLSAALNLSRNNLTGPIPEDLSNLKALAVLDFSYNHLSGIIPALDLPNLTVLNVSSNNLEGLIPSSLETFAAGSFANNSKLCGSVISKVCIHKHGFLVWWKILALASAILLVVGSIMAFVFNFLFLHQRNIIEAVNEDFPHGFTKFSISELCMATDNFSSSNIVGSGAMSTVYKGQLPDGRYIAIKKMLTTGIYSSKYPRKLFLRELHTLGTLRHRNLGRVIGYCSTTDLMSIILEFMPNGSLEKQLHEQSSCRLETFNTWEVRYKIALGTAQGLEYLHQHCSSPVIHCDLKPANILLDTDLQPHISDFGIAKIQNAGNLGGTTSSFKGTVGYMPPEYSCSSTASKEGDVFSYGVVLLELVTGKRPTSDVFGDGRSLVHWARSHFPGQAETILDERISFDQCRELEQKEMLQVLGIALTCTKDDPQHRPTMQGVLSFLTKKDAVLSWKQDHSIEVLAHASSPYDASSNNRSESCGSSS